MSRARPISPALVAKAGSIVRQRTGLVFREPRRSALAAGLAAGLRRSDAAGPDEYIDRLSTEAQLLDDLVAEITVGETYFFRDENQFSAIRDQILPDLRSSAGSARALQLWSAGCATGEEAYSLAILMRERAEAARVIGTDISRRALGTARRGVYREWSLRGVPEAVVRQYFRTARGRYELGRGIRDSVEFTYLNLAEAAYPSHAIGIADMDLILCRNVLIYFDAATVARVAARLIDSLRPGGWLLVGA
ncbi:MAG: CheR family methyltransferase, partial [Longimicrobiales bacterium]